MVYQIKALVAGLLILCAGAVCAQTAPQKKVVSSPLEYKLPVSLNTPRGLDLDRYGRMYVVDAGRHVIMRFGLNGGLERSWPNTVHEAQYAGGRRTMTVTPEGTVFLGCGDYERDVKRIAPSGETILPLAEREDGNVISASDDGSYVTLIRDVKRDKDRAEFLDVRILKHSPDGKVTSTVTIASDVRVEIGPEQMIYTLDQENPVVTVYGFDGKVARQINLQIDKDEFKGKLRYSLQVDTNGDIYCGSALKVARFDRSGQLLDSWNPTERTNDGTWQTSFFRVRNGLIYAVMGLLVQEDPKGVRNSFVRRTSTEIRLFTPDGQCVVRYTPRTTEINAPSSVAVGEDGSYILVEHGTDTIYFYGPEGRKRISLSPIGRMTPTLAVAKPGGGYFLGVTELDSKGNLVANHYERDPNFEDSSVDIPVQVTVDPVTKNVWALGGCGSLTYYNPEGKIQKWFGENPKLNFRTWAIGMAMDHKGYIYLPDPWKHHILKLDQTGSIVATIGKEGSGLGELKFPEGIVIDDKDRIYVADCENSRIQVFSTDGTPIAVWGKPGSGDGELNRPFGLTIGPGNVLWIADTYNDRIVKLQLNDFWGEAKKEVAPVVVLEAPKPKPIPEPGLVSVEGIVVAGSDDFDDVVYLESQDRLWGTKVTLPKDKYVLRGRKVKATGTLELIDRAAKHLKARTFQVTDENVTKIAPFGMSNIYVGDGYRSGDKKMDISNLGLLIRTWGKVVSVDQAKRYFIINDGSYPLGKGLVIYAGNLRKPLIDWPVVDQYVCVTGISITWASTDGKYTAGLRVRCDEDIKTLE